MPTSSSLVTNLPADFNTFGQGVDTSLQDLLGGTTGQVLSKTSGTNMDFTWVTPTDQTPLTTKGDLFAFTTVDARLAVGADGTALVADSAQATGLAYKTPGVLNGLTTTGDTIYSSSGTTQARLAIGTTGQVLTVAAGVPSWATPSSGTPSFVGCRVTNVADQSIASSTRTILTFDTETFDTNTFHDTSTNTGRMTIPSGKAGKYLVTAAVTFATSSTSYREIYLFKNGNFYSQVFPAPSGTGSSGAVLSDLVDLAVADYLEIRVEQGTGGALAVRGSGWGAGATYFGITYLGA